MLSSANSAPPRQRMIPNPRYQRKNEARSRGVNLSRRPDAQILAARAGEVATKAPSAIARVLTNRFTRIDIRLLTFRTNDLEGHQRRSGHALHPRYTTIAANPW